MNMDVIPNSGAGKFAYINPNVETLRLNRLLQKKPGTFNHLEKIAHFSVFKL